MYNIYYTISTPESTRCSGENSTEADHMYCTAFTVLFKLIVVSYLANKLNHHRPFGAAASARDGDLETRFYPSGLGAPFARTDANHGVKGHPQCGKLVAGQQRGAIYIVAIYF